MECCPPLYTNTPCSQATREVDDHLACTGCLEAYLCICDLQEFYMTWQVSELTCTLRHSYPIRNTQIQYVIRNTLKIRVLLLQGKYSSQKYVKINTYSKHNYAYMYIHTTADCHLLGLSHVFEAKNNYFSSLSHSGNSSSYSRLPICLIRRRSVNTLWHTSDHWRELTHGSRLLRFWLCMNQGAPTRSHEHVEATLQ